MHAAGMHFTVLPDWNSLESVRHAHTKLELVALSFFALLVVAEALAHLTEDKNRERLFDKIGIVFFAIAVLAEIAAFPYGQRNDTLSEQVIGSLDLKASDAAKQAARAVTDSGAAIDQARESQNKSANAITSASTALTLARGARSEADSFENDIKLAKRTAASAESHLADALERAANAEKELDLLKTPRGVSDPSALSAMLQQFKGTEYTFFGVFQDQESMDLLTQLNGILEAAGWKRVKLPDGRHFGDLNLNVSKDLSVPISSRSGITVEVESTEKIDSLKGQLDVLRPKHLQAAIALRNGLASWLNPPQHDLTGPLQVDTGPTTYVWISVGKKP